MAVCNQADECLSSTCSLPAWPACPPACLPACLPARLPADYMYTLQGLEGEAREEAKRGCHRRGARRLLNVCFKNGGIYIKLGQHIGMLVRAVLSCAFCAVWGSSWGSTSACWCVLCCAVLCCAVHAGCVERWRFAVLPVKAAVWVVAAAKVHTRRYWCVSTHASAAPYDAQSNKQTHAPCSPHMHTAGPPAPQ